MNNLAARLDRLPISSFHRNLLIMVGGGMFFDGFDNYLANSVLSILIENNWSTLQLNAWFLSGTSLGMLLGSIMAGYLGDKHGRKSTYQINLLIFGIASIACAFASNMYWLIFFRFITGIGLGSEIVVGYGLLTEFIPPSHRGRWGALMSFIGQFGLFFVTFTSWIIIPIAGWRSMFVIAGIGAIVVYLARKHLPESPRWLSRKGRYDEAEKIVRNIEIQYYQDNLEPANKATNTDLFSKQKNHIFETRFRIRILLGSLMMTVQSVSIYGFVAWLPSLMVSQGISANDSLTITVLMTLGGPTGAIFAYFLTDKIGRKPAIILGSLLAALSGILYALTTSQLAATICGFITFSLIYYLVSVIQAGYIPELFPTDVRMRLSAVCVIAGRIASIIMPFFVVFLYNTGGILMVTSLIAILLCIQAIAVFFIGIETSQKSLESIQ
ncbi:MULTISPECIES: MFS transporter [unclassified Gilliamella]|uniref:MFS transporter n=1 Tax=unclassified Gilliamella TaxID=2685620 RepID=UPI00226AA630|nr:MULTISPECIES: MFS transporter [unclassified Gilliamella]MCX8585584.1 MFS transporter [Gilliamella sp. B3562]MCX8685495.1 MFS transporter [Gilliamella sp. B2864]